MAKQPELMDKIVSLCKRRGFIFQSSEIYGGLNSCYDYGPLGVELKRNVKEAWWRAMVVEREDVVGLDSAIIQHPKVWESSGHLKGFTDPLVDCKQCKGRYRADKLDDYTCPTPEYKKRCVGECQKAGLFTEVRQFNLMFKTFMGPVEESASVAYLRPETAQGIFTNFVNVANSSRMKPPFGVAQIGKSFRNEITPGNFVFRTREFEQMEMEFFLPPGDDEQWYEYWVKERFAWYQRYGIRVDRLRLREHAADELAHYSTGCTDVEYEYPFGWGELEGIAKRGNFDLTQHSQGCGKEQSFFDQDRKEHYLPHVVEPAAGCDRTAITFLIDAYEEQVLGVDEKTNQPDIRVVLHFHPLIAPVTVAVFPLVKKEGMPDKARAIVQTLREAGIRTEYDEKGAIGKRYRRMDEVGTPWCVTVDGDTLKDDTVTLRDRDTMQQERVAIGEIERVLRQRIREWQRG